MTDDAVAADYNNDEDDCDDSNDTNELMMMMVNCKAIVGGLWRCF